MKLLASLFSQFLPVAIGVFLGLWANNWNESRKQEAAQHQMLQQMLEELNNNKASLEKAIPYHQRIGAVLDSLQSVLSSDELQQTMSASGGLAAIPSWKGMKMPIMDNSVYQSALVSGGFTGLDFNILRQIAQTQSMYTIYNKFFDILLERLSSLNGQTTKAELFDRLAIIGHDIVDIEASLVRTQEQTVQKIQEMLGHEQR